MTTARASEALLSTRPLSTSPAPTAASTSRKKKVTAEAQVTRWARNRRAAQMRSTRPKIPESPLVTRWVYSMIRSTEGFIGITCPSHRGQWLPQPAPEWLMRTQAPKRITKTR